MAQLDPQLRVSQDTRSWPGDFFTGHPTREAATSLLMGWFAAFSPCSRRVHGILLLQSQQREKEKERPTRVLPETQRKPET